MADSNDTKRANPADIARLLGEVSVDGSGRLVTDDGRDVAAVLLGRRGGLIGGKARANKLTGEERSQIAKRAALARWRTGD